MEKMKHKALREYLKDAENKRTRQRYPGLMPESGFYVYGTLPPNASLWRILFREAVIRFREWKRDGQKETRKKGTQTR